MSNHPRPGGQSIWRRLPVSSHPQIQRRLRRDKKHRGWIPGTDLIFFYIRNILSLTHSLTNVTPRMSRHREWSYIMFYASQVSSDLGALFLFPNTITSPEVGIYERKKSKDPLNFFFSWSIAWSRSCFLESYFFLVDSLFSLFFFSCFLPFFLVDGVFSFFYINSRLKDMRGSEEMLGVESRKENSEERYRLDECSASITDKALRLKYIRTPDGRTQWFVEVASAS